MHGLGVLAAALLGACTGQSADPTPSTPSSADAATAPASNAADAIPTEADLEEEAETSLDADDLSGELDRLEKQIGG